MSGLSRSVIGEPPVFRLAGPPFEKPIPKRGGWVGRHFGKAVIALLGPEANGIRPQRVLPDVEGELRFDGSEPFPTAGAVAGDARDCDFSLRECCDFVDQHPIAPPALRGPLDTALQEVLHRRAELLERRVCPIAVFDCASRRERSRRACSHRFQFFLRQVLPSRNDRGVLISQTSLVDAIVFCHTNNL